MYRVEIVVSGSGEQIFWENVETLAEAKDSVARLDAAWLKWCEEDMKGEPWRAVKHYEGCDVYAVDASTGTRWFYNEDEEWEVL